MGLIESINGKFIYLDTNIWIYAIEAYPDYLELLQQIFEKIDQQKLIAVTSELTIDEVLVKPFQDNNLQAKQAYQNILQSSDSVKVIAINRNILQVAARLRAITKLKLPDAIHVATALDQKINIFITNDTGFPSISDVQVLRLIDFL